MNEYDTHVDADGDGLLDSAEYDNDFDGRYNTVETDSSYNGTFDTVTTATRRPTRTCRRNVPARRRYGYRS